MLSLFILVFLDNAIDFTPEIRKKPKGCFKFIDPFRIAPVAMPMVEFFPLADAVGIVKAEQTFSRAIVQGQGMADAMRDFRSRRHTTRHEFDP